MDAGASVSEELFLEYNGSPFVRVSEPIGGATLFKLEADKRVKIEDPFRAAHIFLNSSAVSREKAIGLATKLSAQGLSPHRVNGK